jgi:hypothetical protein
MNTKLIHSLQQATADLESGHPIEVILLELGVSENWTAYDVVCRWHMHKITAETAQTDFARKRAKCFVQQLQPAVDAIAEHFGEGQ